MSGSTPTQRLRTLMDSFSDRQFIFLKGGTDQGTDTNGNGLFDRLDINLDVDVIADGLYSWSGRLVDQNGTELGFTTGSASFTRGINIATFSFDGTQ